MTDEQINAMLNPDNVKVIDLTNPDDWSKQQADTLPWELLDVFPAL